MVTNIFGKAPPPSGTVVFFNGEPLNIPTGWVFCDGNNGTPDLRNMFQKGIPNSITSPGTEVGQHSLTLTESQMPSHNHIVPGTDSVGDHNHTVPLSNASYNAGGNGEPSITNQNANQSVSSGGAHSHTISVDNSGSDVSIDNRPSFIKYTPMMKI